MAVLKRKMIGLLQTVRLNPDNPGFHLQKLVTICLLDNSNTVTVIKILCQNIRNELDIKI